MGKNFWGKKLKTEPESEPESLEAVFTEKKASICLWMRNFLFSYRATRIFQASSKFASVSKIEPDRKIQRIFEPEPEPEPQVSKLIFLLEPEPENVVRFVTIKKIKRNKIIMIRNRC